MGNGIAHIAFHAIIAALMSTPESPDGQTHHTSTTKLLAIIVLFAAFGVALSFLPLPQWSQQLREHIRALGWLAPAAYVLAYIAFTVFLIPPTVLSFISGSLFGWGWGVTLTLLGGNLGSLLAFLLARTVMRERVQQWAQHHPRFAAVDQAISENGFKIELLMRFSPMFPFAMTNYLLGVTRVPLWKYAAATLVGMPPITCIVVYIGTLPAEVAAEWNTGRIALQIAGAIVAVILGILITHYARQALQQQTPSELRK